MTEQEPVGAFEPIQTATVSRVDAPWRRFFARSLDASIYSAVSGLFLMVVLPGGYDLEPTAKLFWIIIFLPLNILVETVLLARFGTTVGKWVLGLSVTGLDGKRLSFQQALRRTCLVWWYGQGLDLPIFSLVRYWISYDACTAGKILRWETDTVLHLRDKRLRRVAWYLVLNVLLVVVQIGGAVAVNFVSALPAHRGEITVAEFCDNYNRVLDHNGDSEARRLDKTGNWVAAQSGDEIIVVEAYPPPEVVFTTKDGVMTGMQFSVQLQNSPTAPSYQTELLAASHAFLRAQETCPLFSREYRQSLKKIASAPFEDFQFEAYGVTLACEVAHTGYMDTAGTDSLWSQEGTPTTFVLDFSMTKR